MLASDDNALLPSPLPQTNLVASGGNESEIYIWDLNNFGSPMTPGPKTQVRPIAPKHVSAWLTKKSISIDIFTFFFGVLSLKMLIGYLVYEDPAPR